MKVKELIDRLNEINAPDLEVCLPDQSTINHVMVAGKETQIQVGDKTTPGWDTIILFCNQKPEIK